MAWRLVGRQARRVAFLSFPRSASDVAIAPISWRCDPIYDWSLPYIRRPCILIVVERGRGLKPPLETIGPAGKLEMRRTGGVAKQGKRNPAMRGVQSPERYRDARTCPEKRVRFPRRPDSSKKIAPGWLKCRGNRCGRYLGKSRYRPHRHISAVRLGRHSKHVQLRRKHREARRRGNR